MISSKIIKDSISPAGKRLTTFELEYPRFIHSEVMTHRMLSKNAASSRAIPITATIKQLLEDPAMPVWWGKSQAGMQAKEELAENEKLIAKSLWVEARDNAIRIARQMNELGLHKQITNRILEPWVNMKTVLTGTEYDNMLYLRDHEDTQPEFAVLGGDMVWQMNNSKPRDLDYGEWHLPYVEDLDIPIEDQLKLSSSLCAQVSFRKADESIEKAITIYDRLVTSAPVHASPFEHQGTPAVDGDFRSGNLIGWIQFRQQIAGNVCNRYEKLKLWR